MQNDKINSLRFVPNFPASNKMGACQSESCAKRDSETDLLRFELAQRLSFPPLSRFSNAFPPLPLHPLPPARQHIYIRILSWSLCSLAFPMHNLKRCLLFGAAFKGKSAVDPSARPASSTAAERG